MKISVRRLREYINLQISDESLCELFTDIGLEVEGIEKFGLSKQNTLVVGEIQEIAKHPNADKLLVCKVLVGQDDLKQIVCGAKNFKLGDHVPVALPGTILPENFEIKKGNIRGVNSDGMMCSGKELGLGDDHSGLLILDKTTKVGALLHDAINVNSDTVFDISLTANRGDCLSYIGIARDLAAKLSLEVKFPEFKTLETSLNTRPENHFLEQISVETDNCECYSAICVKGIKIGTSPDWIKQALAAAGIRSINNAVDIGNFVMIETGQPIHIFDAKKISGNKLIIRQAREGEKITALDGNTKILPPEITIISDASHPLVIAGITGSIDAEIDETTTDILIESAYFNPDNIRTSSRKLNISTESSYRFSRDIDTSKITTYGSRVADLMIKLCGGEIVSSCWQVGSPKRQTVSLNFNPSDIKKLCGFNIPLDDAKNILTRLGFEIAVSGEIWQITIPAHRPDIACAEDITSECLRIYGTKNITASQTKGSAIHRDTDKIVLLTKNSRDYLSSSRFFECCTPSLRSAQETERFAGVGSAIKMKNPLNAELDCYRNSLIFGLLDSLKLNLQNGNFDTKFFEIGHVCVKIDEKFNECLAISLLSITKNIERTWVSEQEYDFFSAKDLIFPILKNLSSKPHHFEPIADTSIWQKGHSARCGNLVHEKFHAACGLLNPNLTKFFDIKQHVIAAEIVIHQSIFDKKNPKATYKPFSQFPRISKDLSLIVKSAEYAENVQSNVIKIAKKHTPKDVYIESANIFDVYKGKNLAPGTKNIGLTINFRSDIRTLTDHEIQTTFEALQNEINSIYKVRRIS